jgi:putative ABC transport system permease protein
MFESILQDVRYGMRQLRQSPGFMLAAVLSLALGIGANTAIFELVNAIRLKMLPVRNPRELVAIDFERDSLRAGWFSTRSARLTYAQWDQIRAQQQAFTGVLAWSAGRFNLATGGEARNAEGLYVSGDFFRTLGVNAVLGRVFTAEDDTEACGNPGAVISHAFWQREFGGDSGVLTRTIRLDGHPIPVIGVTPPSFFGVEVGNRYDVAIPLCADRSLSDDQKGRIPVRHAYWLSMMGRLKPGAASNPAGPSSAPRRNYARCRPASCKRHCRQSTSPTWPSGIWRTNWLPRTVAQAYQDCGRSMNARSGC